MFQYLYHPFFIVGRLTLLAWLPGRNLCVCKASTVSTARNPVDWNQRRKELERRLISIAGTASDVLISNKKKQFDYMKDGAIEEPIGLAGYRGDFVGENETIQAPQEELKYGFGQSFAFQRFQSPSSIRKALKQIRPASSFKWFEGKDGRKGYVSSTKLGGDYVLAESRQIAINCRTEDVLRVYLSGKLQASWNTASCLQCYIKKFKKKNYPSHLNYISGCPAKPRRLNLWSSRAQDNTHETGQIQKQKRNTNSTWKETCFYIQDTILKSQRVIRGQTGPMRYQQIIEIDKVGQHNYAILVRLLNNKSYLKTESNCQIDIQRDLSDAFKTTTKKPFESLEVYVGLEQMGKDVKIYAAGVFEVNREVVPKLIVFDTSGFAGSLAGKGTLWLSGYFETVWMKRTTKTA